MFYSKSAKYAIQAMIYLAESNQDELIMVSEIAEAYKIPKSFLSKITRTLGKHNLLKTTRGRNGGIQLSKPATDIKLKHIVEAIDGPEASLNRCGFGFDTCSEDEPCPFHHKWGHFIHEAHTFIETESLAELMDHPVVS